jgi:hypothetical protein
MFTILVTVCHLPTFFDCVFIVAGEADIILYGSGCLSRVFHVRSTWGRCDPPETLDEAVFQWLTT